MRQMFCKGLFIAALSGVLVTGAQAQEKVRIGVLNDQTGVFATYQGLGSVVAAQMAVEDYGGKAAGKVVEVVSADHQNKPDIGVGIARRWYENESVGIALSGSTIRSRRAPTRRSSASMSPSALRRSHAPTSASSSLSLAGRRQSTRAARYPARSTQAR